MVLPKYASFKSTGDTTSIDTMADGQSHSTAGDKLTPEGLAAAM
jgi:hypothetical protein